jgi:predicted phage terminase large subunit-like protein
MGEDAEFFLACDPSVGESVTKNDYSAIAIVARDKKHKVMYLIEADIKRRSLDDLLEDILAYCKRYKFVKIGFEANNFQMLLIPKFKKLLQDNKLYLDVVPIKNMTDKVRRILGLLPYFKSGQLQLSRNFRLLLEQLQFFPRAKYDDGPDAVEMVVRLCEDNQNDFWCWVGGKTIDPWTGEILTTEEQMKRAATMTADGRVQYGRFHGRR